MAGDYQGSPIIIPFGSDSVAPEQISRNETADGKRIECRLPHVILDPAARLPLRLNSGGMEFGEPPPLPQMPEISDQLAYLLTHFQLYCTVWDKFPRAFLARYIGFIHDQVMDHREELTRSLAPFGDLYRFDEWTFSALRPLPRAHLWIPKFDGGRMFRVDFAFWTGAEIVAIELRGSETETKSDARREEILTQNGVRVVQISHDLLTEARARDYAARLPAEFHRFWETEPLPSGPFRPDTMPNPI
jgi:hypothetical protein